MKELTISLLLYGSVFAQCFPVTPSQGGNLSVQLFFCKIPGCAAKVTCIYCNDELLFSHTHIAACTGPPPPNTVCQHDGRAFISTNADVECEFEGNSGYIITEKCRDHIDICDFISTNLTSPPVSAEDTLKDHAERGSIVV